MSKIESRFINHALQTIEPKAGEDEMIIEGKAVCFDSPSRDMGFVETISKNCIIETLDNDVIATFNHDDSQYLGREKNGSLKLERRNDGIYYTLQLPDTQTGRDVFKLAKRGDLSGNSFEMRVEEDQWSLNYSERTIEKMTLFKINPLTNAPAYPGANIIDTRGAKLADELTKIKKKYGYEN